MSVPSGVGRTGRGWCVAVGLLLGAPAARAGAPTLPPDFTLPSPAPPVAGQPIVVAVVDDAFRVDHVELADLLWRNPQEVPANGVDDDGNGRVDDVLGWDVAGGDADVRPPVERRGALGHGTHLAGVVARVARAVHGDAAGEAVRILPVKAMEDDTPRPYLIPGYDGVAYALDAGADIILCAWSVGKLEAGQRAILDRAQAEGVLVVGSAGNLGTNDPQFPAAHPGVLSVAALDGALQHLTRSSFGATVDLVAPGWEVEGPDAATTEGVRLESGTSPAAALVAGAAAVLWRAHPDWSALEVRAALLSGARNLVYADERVAASMGAGLVDLAASFARSPWEPRGIWAKSTGLLPLVAPGAETVGFSLLPPGEVTEVRLQLTVQRGGAAALRRSSLAVHAGRSDDTPAVWAGPLEAFPGEVVVPGDRAYVRFTPGRPALAAFLRVEAEPLDVSRRWCGDTVVLDAPGVIEDGSGASPYASGTSCKWHIRAPEGQVVRFEVEALDTESGVDQVLFFDGSTTADEAFAGLSGQGPPPSFTSWRNEVLVWFVTNLENEGQGWRLRTSFEPAPAR